MIIANTVGYIEQDIILWKKTQKHRNVEEQECYHIMSLYHHIMCLYCNIILQYYYMPAMYIPVEYLKWEMRAGLC